MSSPQYLKKTIEDLDNTSPVLIIGDAMTLFLKAWKYKTVSISNVNDLKDAVDYYSMVAPSTPLVIYDLSIIPKDKLSILLKFVEEYKHPLILLGSIDNFDSIILSRIKTFVKFNVSKTSCDFLTTREGLKLSDDKLSKDMSNVDKNKFYMKYCPKLYYLDKSLSVYKNKNKIIDILS